jgi:HK97 family phage prohead protease
VRNSFIPVEKFRELGANGATLADTGVYLGATVEVKAEGTAKRELSFTVSTATVDRAGDSVNVAGWDLAAFKRNPVVLWAHSYNLPPVARAVEISVSGGALKALTEWTDKYSGIGPDPNVVYEYYRDGFMSAVSVGFMPTKWAFVEEASRKYGIDFMEQELLEFSAVPVPANPDALIEGKGAIQPNVSAWIADLAKQHGAFKCNDIRDFEGFLRDVGGFSRSEAKAVASHGWKAKDGQREADGPKLDDVTKLLTEFREKLKGSH